MFDCKSIVQTISSLEYCIHFLLLEKKKPFIFSNVTEQSFIILELRWQKSSTNMARFSAQAKIIASVGHSYLELRGFFQAHSCY